MLTGMGLIIARYDRLLHASRPSVMPLHVLLICRCVCTVVLCCSQCVQAAQITFEDFFMADLAIPPLKIVGYEGVLGAATMLLLVLPIVQVRTGGRAKLRLVQVCIGHMPGWHKAPNSHTRLLCAAHARPGRAGPSRGFLGHLACEIASLIRLAFSCDYVPCISIHPCLVPSCLSCACCHR